MRKMIIVAAMGLMLASCGTTSQTTVGNDVTALVAQVKAAVTAACGFVINPTAANVAAIVAQITNTPNVEAVAQAICTAAQSLLSRRYGATANITFLVNGKPITGHF